MSRAAAGRWLTGAAVLWVGLAVATFASRPLLPIDETRYAAVAWEMWCDGSWLVPHLNGAPYAEKPPLLFWIVGAGWSVLGVHGWWARLAPTLFPLAALFLVRGVARLVWPDDERAAGIAPWILMGTGLWAVVSTAMLFDGMLATLALLAVYGTARAWRGRPATGWTLAAAAAGLGILTKGPVILVPVVPVWVLAPWWSGPDDRVRAGRWYAQAAAALAGAAAVGLAWAVPAARAGGEAYGQTILWSQTADRVVSSFAHGRAWWWYVAQLPWIVFPWSLWPPVWRALGALRSATADAGVRLCAAWLAPPFVLFSAIHGKQPQYLLPLLPAFALLVSRALSRRAPRAGRVARLPVAASVVGLGTAVAAVALGAGAGRLPAWAADLPLWTAGGLVAVAALAVALPALGFATDARALATTVVAALALLYAGLFPAAGRAYDMRPLAAVLERAQERGRAVATPGTYHGQYHFVGRLRAPITSLRDTDPGEWCRDHPDGLVITYPEALPTAPGPAPVWAQPYRSRAVAVWSCGDLPGFP